MIKFGLKKLLIALPFSYFVFTQDPSFYTSAMVLFPKIGNAITYNINYKEHYRFSFNHTVKNLSNTLTFFIINDLKENIGYDYEITATNNKGEEILVSSLKVLKN